MTKRKKGLLDAKAEIEEGRAAPPESTAEAVDDVRRIEALRDPQTHKGQLAAEARRWLRESEGGP